VSVRHDTTRSRSVFLIGLLVWTLLHLFWVFTENINGDEFILLARARDTFLSGQVLSGGRPGLGTIALIPFVQTCSDAIASVRAARVMWTVFGVIILTGSWTTLRYLFAGRETGAVDALIGVTLLALTPGFLRYSIQVRTDQPAVALGILAASFLLASRHRLRWAFAAGILFGIGYLFSQKLLYVGALAGLLVAGDILLAKDLVPSREFKRFSAVVVTFLFVVIAYQTVIPLLFEPSKPLNVGAQMSDFRYYHEVIGYYFYKLMAVELIPYAILAGLAVAGSVKLIRRGGWEDRISLLLACLIACLGIMVAWFHAGRFPYFWITLGLFPAVAVASALPAIRAASKGNSIPTFWLRSAFAVLGFFAALEAAYLSVDSQEIQSDSLRFVDENFAAEARGFHPERAHLCRDDPEHFQAFVIQSIARRFEWVEDTDSSLASFMADFETRPVEFLIESFLMDWYPSELQEFWAAHYTRYATAVFVPGLRVEAAHGVPHRFDVIVPGEYQWRPAHDSQSDRIRIGEDELGPDESIVLDRGVYFINTGSVAADGLFTLRMRDDPSLDAEDFYTGFLPSWVWLGLRLTRS